MSVAHLAPTNKIDAPIVKNVVGRLRGPIGPDVSSKDSADRLRDRIPQSGKNTVEPSNDPVLDCMFLLEPRHTIPLSF